MSSFQAQLFAKREHEGVVQMLEVSCRLHGHVPVCPPWLQAKATPPTPDTPPMPPYAPLIPQPNPPEPSLDSFGNVDTGEQMLDITENTFMHDVTSLSYLKGLFLFLFFFSCSAWLHFGA